MPSLRPLRVRRTLAPTGELPPARSVDCPNRGCSIDFASCLRCFHFAGVEQGHPPSVSCDAAGPSRCLLASASPAGTTPVTDLMTNEVWCVTRELPLVSLRDLLVEEHVSGVPVVDEQGQPFGVISRTDLIDPPLRDGERVGDRVAPLAFTVEETATVAQAAALMAIEGVHRVAVVDGSGQVVGIVSSLDFARWVAEQDGYRIR